MSEQSNSSRSTCTSSLVLAANKSTLDEVFQVACLRHTTFAAPAEPLEANDGITALGFIHSTHHMIRFTLIDLL
jgi:hypothetical protein